MILPENSPEIGLANGRATAFSIIECIVVIAIVSVLALLVLPMVGSLREKAGSSGCLNNLRTIGVAFQSYASDNNGILPQNNGIVGGLSWYSIIDQYAGCDYGAIYSNPALVKKSPLFCPSERELVQPFSCYSINRELDISISGEASRIPQSALNQPSRYVVVSDSFKASKIYTDSKTKMTEWTYMSRRHGGFPNFLYADWHVDSFREPLTGLGDAGGKTPFYQALWLARYQP